MARVDRNTYSPRISTSMPRVFAPTGGHCVTSCKQSFIAQLTLFPPAENVIVSSGPMSAPPDCLIFAAILPTVAPQVFGQFAQFSEWTAV